MRATPFVVVFSVGAVCSAIGCGLNATPDAPHDLVLDGDGGALLADATAGDTSLDGVAADGGAPSLGDGANAGGPDAGVDGGDAEVAPLPANAVLLSAGGFVGGSTSDGYAVYFRPTDLNNPLAPWLVEASKVDGTGAVLTIGSFISTVAADGSFAVTSASPAVMFWDKCDVPTDPRAITACRLRLWSAATGTRTIEGRSALGASAVSNDGTSVMYIGHVNSNGSVGSLIGASTATNGETVLAPIAGLGALANSCNPGLLFAGSRGIAIYCQPGETNPTIDSFGYPFADAPGVKLAGQANISGGSTNLNQAVWTNSSGSLLFAIVRPDSTAAWRPTLVDTTTGATQPVQSVLDTLVGATSGGFAETSGYVVVNGSELYRFSITDATSIASGVGDVLAVSNEAAFFSTRRDSDAGRDTNLFVVTFDPVTKSATVKNITSQTNGLFLAGTSDGTSVTYLLGEHDGLGTLMAAPLMSSGPARVVLPNGTSSIAMGPGAKLITFGNPDGPLPAIGGVFFADLATSTPAKLIVSNVNPFGLSIDATQSRVLFNYVGTNGVPGAYSLLLP